MGKTDIVLISKQTAVNVSEDTTPLVLTQVCPSSDKFEGGLVELKVLKHNRRLVVKVQQIDEGVTVKIAIERDGEFLEEINLTNDSDLEVTFDLKKHDKLFFGYTYPSELEQAPNMDFKLKVQKKHHC